jgi:hypothetical protein
VVFELPGLPVSAVGTRLGLRGFTRRLSPVTAEQLSQDILVQPCVGFGGVQVFRGGTAFQCPEPLVFIDRHHHGLTAKVKAYEVVLVAMPSRLCAHGYTLEAAVMFGIDIGRRGV